MHSRCSAHDSPLCLGTTGVPAVRLLVFAVIWVATGKRVWFFPRILEEEGSLAELFRFMPDKDEDPPAKITTRAVVAIVLAFSFWLMVKYAPDENTRARSALPPFLVPSFSPCCRVPALTALVSTSFWLAVIM